MLIERVKVNRSHTFILEDPANANKDICEWAGVDCDGAGNVVSVAWEFCCLSGYMDLSWIPPKTARFFLQGNDVSGTLEAVKLPRGLRIIDIDGCAFHGELRFLDLPASLETLNVAGNNLTGMVWITGAQRNLRNADIRLNFFENIISDSAQSFAVIRGLPSVVELAENQHLYRMIATIKNRDTLVSREHEHKVWLRSVYADDEGHIQNIFWPRMMLEGEVQLHGLPQFLRSMHMNDNKISGRLDCQSLPVSLRVMDFRNNLITQEVLQIDIGVNLESVDLRGNDIKQVQSVDGGDVSIVKV